MIKVAITRQIKTLDFKYMFVMHLDDMELDTNKVVTANQGQTINLM